jgi:hypothetical protein
MYVEKVYRCDNEKMKDIDEKYVHGIQYYGIRSYSPCIYPPRTCVTFLEKVNIEPSTKNQQQVTLPVNTHRPQQKHHAFPVVGEPVSCRRRKKGVLAFLC